MASKVGDRFEDAVDETGADGGEVRDTLFGSMARSAASAVVSVAATYAAGWLIKKLFDRGEQPGSSDGEDNGARG